MYSRNRMHREQNAFSVDLGKYVSQQVSPEDELYSYNLPPRYDGSRFSPRRRDNPSPVSDDRETIISEENAELECVEPEAKRCTEYTHGDAVRSILESIGSEELMIIAVILMIAGGEDSGDLLLLLILLLLHG